MYPLFVLCGAREIVDGRLIHCDPVGHADFGADQGLRLGECGLKGRHRSAFYKGAVVTRARRLERDLREVFLGDWDDGEFQVRAAQKGANCWGLKQRRPCRPVWKRG